jgi:hypothetical protein
MAVYFIQFDQGCDAGLELPTIRPRPKFCVTPAKIPTTGTKKFGFYAL